MRIVHGQPPTATGTHHGLAWASFAPRGTPHGAVLVLHGADSVKENQFDFARAAAAAGLLAVGFDARGHGASGGELGDGAVDDVVAMAQFARSLSGGQATPLGLRGSSMGGFFALACAEAAGADAVVAICPAGGEHLRAGLTAGRFAFACDRAALAALLDAHDVHDAVRRLDVPLLLLHARGDLQIPVEHSQELAAVAPQCRYVELPGGHHQSIQHDAELLGVSVRFLARALKAGGAA
ncbi:MAG: lysophospholipase [Solirubrobacterales bacterium]|jgi:pimeloyl-ACP methyl ester carboxylesterase|nr:lysophospholipase [Solirubrobacterales bacterium]